MKEKSTEVNKKLINLDKVLKDKKLTYLPKFVVNYLKRTVHQDEINAFIEQYHHLDAVDFIEAAFRDFKIKRIIKGTENIPEKPQRPLLFIANHPLGGFDGLMLINFINQKVGPGKALINDVLLNVKNLRSVFVGMNLYGGKSRESLKRLDETFEIGEHMMLFPAGLVSRRKKGVIRDPEWKNTFIKRAIKHERDIIPVHFSGGLTNFFYNLSNFRKFIGIKFNFELVYLPDELFKQKGQTITMTIGKPVKLEQIKASGSIGEWVSKIREMVYALEEA